jgi:hypothetical protein
MSILTDTFDAVNNLTTDLNSSFQPQAEPQINATIPDQNIQIDMGQVALCQQSIAGVESVANMTADDGFSTSTTANMLPGAGQGLNNQKWAWTNRAQNDWQQQVDKTMQPGSMT